jgi:hypothetical protein
MVGSPKSDVPTTMAKKRPTPTEFWGASGVTTGSCPFGVSGG